MRGRAGFTIVEVLITVAIVGIIAIAGFGFNFFVNSYNMARDTFLNVHAYTHIYTKGMIALDMIARGTENNKGLMESQSVTVPTPGGSGDTIEFLDGQDGVTTRSFYLSGDDLIYEGGSTLTVINGNVTTLTFTRPPGQDDLVDIELVLEDNLLGTNVTVELDSSVKLRNAQ